MRYIRVITHLYTNLFTNFLGHPSTWIYLKCTVAITAGIFFWQSFQLIGVKLRQNRRRSLPFSALAIPPMFSSMRQEVELCLLRMMDKGDLDVC